MKLPQPIPYQGSKRGIADSILSYFPKEVDMLIEPFCGSAAITIAAARLKRAKKFHLNDINKPLIDLWDMIINHPEAISNGYEEIWSKQSIASNEYYNKIRDDFNKTHEPSKFLYLLARCVKGAVRYNTNAEFNQSPDKRRKGKNPYTLQKEIFEISSLLKGKATLSAKNYLDIFEKATEHDLLYLDPPYQGVCERRDTRYYNKVVHNEFVESLALLNKRHVPFILSYDGRTGEKRYGQELPLDLRLKRIEIHAGRSTQSTFLGKAEITYESIYLSPYLLQKSEVAVSL